MVSSQPTPDRNNSRDLAYIPPASAEADIAALDSSLQFRSSRPTWDNEFSYCGKHSTVINTLKGGENYVPRNHNDTPYQYTHQESHSVTCLGEGTNGEGRIIPCQVAVRFACRSNGQPLTTIVEKGSYSSLHSWGSLLNITCQYPLPSLGNSAVLYTLKRSRSADGRSYHRNQGLDGPRQNCRQETQESTSPVHPDVGPIVPRSQYNTPLPVEGVPRSSQLPEASQLEGSDNNVEGKGLKGRLREVIQHVRAASRPDESPASLPSLLPHNNTDEESNRVRTEVVGKGDKNSGRVQGGEKGLPEYLLPTSTCCPQLPPNEPFEDWAEDCERSFCDTESSNHELPTIRHVPPEHANTCEEPTLQQGTGAQQSPSSDQIDTQSGPVSAFRDAKSNGGYSKSPTCSQRSREDCSGRYTYDGTPIYRSNAPSLYEFDRSREVSFSNSASTTYSSSVLGVDLDLQQEFPLAVHRSLTPIWVYSSVADRARVNEEAEVQSVRPTPRSVTSSALPVLLPLAVASGIVRPNHAAPYVSFHSPSGNLIQAEPSSSSSSPTTSYYKNALSMSEETPRPAAVPLTTPPHSSIAVPTYLEPRPQQKQVLHGPTRSHIVPQHAVTSTVRGCNGVVLRTDSLTPRSGIPSQRPPSLSSHSKSIPCLPVSGSKSTLSHPQNRVQHSRPRFYTGASCASLSTPRVQRIKKPPKSINPVVSTADSSTKSRPHHVRSRSAIGSSLAPLAAHTMRVCFCQPRDGDGDGDGDGDALPRLRDTGDGAAGGLGEACHDHAQASPLDGRGAEAARMRLLDLGARA